MNKVGKLLNHTITMLLTNPFNPDIRVYKEAVHLIAQGWEVTILCWDRTPDDGLAAEELKDGIQVIRFPIPSQAGSGKKQLPAFFRYIRACRTYLKTHPCKYLHCNDLDGAITGYFARHRKTPMVFDMHEFYERGSGLKRRIWRAMTLFLLRHSVAGLYENTAYLSPAYQSIREKLFPLKNYPDTSMVEPRPKSPDSLFRIGYHGVVRSQVAEFSALFAAVRDLNDVRVDINGGGVDLPQLKELAADIPNVHVNGPFDGTTMTSALYEKTDVLFCGYNPKFPNYQGDAEVVKFYEAIFTATPMIMTENIGMGEKVRSNGFGIACDTRSPEAIRAAILNLKENSAFYQECAAREKLAAKQYNWESAVTVLDQIYQK